MATRIREKHDGALTGRTDVRLWLRLLSCSTAIEKRIRRRFADQFGSTLPRFDVLATLERHPGGVTMTELSRTLLVSNGNVTALVRQLESAGYAESRPMESDRRSFLVMLTERGRIHFTQLAAAHHGWIKGMFAHMPRDDQMALYRLLATLKASIGLEDQAGDGS